MIKQSCLSKIHEDPQVPPPSVHATAHDCNDEENHGHAHNNDNDATTGETRDDVDISIITQQDGETQDDMENIAIAQQDGEVHNATQHLVFALPYINNTRNIIMSSTHTQQVQNARVLEPNQGSHEQ